MQSFENYSDMGLYLQDCRESMKVSIERAAKDLNIRQKYIIALEAGKVNELPSGIYAKGYVQRYAHYLRLDEAQMLEAFDRLSGKVKTTRFYVPEPTRKHNMPTPHVLILSTVMIGFFYALWTFFSSGGATSNMVEVEALPERYARLIDPTQLPQYIASPGWRDCFTPLIAEKPMCQDPAIYKEPLDERVTFLKQDREFSSSLTIDMGKL